MKKVGGAIMLILLLARSVAEAFGFFTIADPWEAMLFNFSIVIGSFYAGWLLFK